MSKLQNWADNEKRLDILRRTSKEVRTYRTQKRVLGAALGGLAVLTTLLFIAAALYNVRGSFSVGVDKVDITKYGLSLSESRDMLYATSRLNANIDERITNISRNDLPDNLDMIDGQHNGENYIAYTFYLQNQGEVAVDYDYEMTISNVTLGLDEAMRVRLYINGECTEYAKTRNDGTGPEPYTKEFYSLGVVTKGIIRDFKPLDQTKFTVVVWLEGDDPECVDRVIDGLAKLEMNFKVIGESETDNLSGNPGGTESGEGA